jgi:predicted Zn finger-like uncharacterized protein
MRLICPNCGAQYEVPDDVIPDEGRDVQCSNCGDTWFQHHPDNDPDLRDELIASGYVEQTATEEVADPDMPADDLSSQATEASDGADTDEHPKRRSLDPSIAEVLREEAEREARARAAEAAPLESQPDLGLTEPEDEEARRARQVRERMARMKGVSEEELEAQSRPTPTPIAEDEDLIEDTPTSRRDLLPDIDEVNSSLRPASDRRPAEAADHELAGDGDRDLLQSRSGSGFRRGFALALMLAAILWAIYSFAPRINAAVPALAPAITQYTNAVDNARAALDEQVRQLLLDAQAQNGS